MKVDQCFVNFNRVTAYSIIVICTVLSVWSPAAFGEEVVLRWQSRDRDPVGGIDINAMIVNAFEEKHPGIRVEYTTTTGDELPIQLIGGSGPDIIDTTGPRIRDLFRNGLLLDLQPYIETIMPVTDRADFFEPQLVALQDDDGNLFAVPKYLGTVGLYYNKQLFDESGTAYPDDTFDWQSLIEFGRRIIRTDSRGEQTQMAFYKSEGLNRVAPWILQNGGRYYVDGDPARSALDEPAAIDALQFLADLRFQHEIWTTRGAGAWGEGRLGMIEEGMWRVLSYTSELPFEFGLAQPPAGPHGRATHATTDGYAIAWHTNFPNESARFLKFLISPEANRIRLRYYGRQPARLSVIRQMPDILYDANPLTESIDFVVFVLAGSYAFPQPFYVNERVSNEVLGTVLRRIFRHNESAASVLQSMIPTLNYQLKEE